MTLDEIKIQIGLRIKEIRRKKKFTQESLAEMVGINSKYLSNIERGLENPTLTTLVKLSQSLDTQIYEFFDLSAQLSPKDNKKAINSLIKTADSEQLRVILRVLSGIIQ